MCLCEGIFFGIWLERQTRFSSLDFHSSITYEEQAEELSHCFARAGIVSSELGESVI